MLYPEPGLQFWLAIVQQFYGALSVHPQDSGKRVLMQDYAIVGYVMQYTGILPQGIRMPRGENPRLIRPPKQLALMLVPAAWIAPCCVEKSVPSSMSLTLPALLIGSALALSGW